MTSDDRDPAIQALFADAQRELDGEAFTAKVVARARFLRYRALTPWIAVVLVLVSAVLFAVPLQDFTRIVALWLTTSLVDLGEGWVGWVVAPINNVASVLVLGFKGIRMLSKRIRNASYAS